MKRLLLAATLLSASLTGQTVPPASPADGDHRLSGEDPLTGSNVWLGSLVGGASGFRTALAYDPVTDRYLVSWIRGSGVPMGMRVIDGDGVPVGPPFVHLGNSSLIPYGSAVVGTTNTEFVIAGTSGNTVIVATWPTEIARPLTSPTARQSLPDVGGGLGRDDAVIVYRDNDNGGAITAARFDVTTMTATNTVVIASSGVVSRISPSAGPNGEYLVMWSHDQGDEDIHGRIIDRDLELLTPEFPIATGPNRELPGDCDGNGSEWFAVYTAAEVPGAYLGDALGVKISFDAAAGTVDVSAPIPIAATPERLECAESVAWTGEAYLVAYCREWVSGSRDLDLWVRSVDEFGCVVCDGDFQVSTATTLEDGAVIASQHSAGGPGEDAFLSYMTGSPTYIEGRQYAGADGRSANLGGGCAGGGDADVTCAAVGGVLGFRTRRAFPGSAAALMLGTPAAVPCGPCTLRVAPVVSVPTVTDAAGDVVLSIPLVDPALVGGELHAQWLVAGNGGCVSLVSFSDAFWLQVE